jgi:hypothetical protein
VDYLALNKYQANFCISSCQSLGYKRKNKIVLAAKLETMEILFSPGEALFLEFQLSNGSGWLTSHRLILCEHERGHIDGHSPFTYSLKDFQKAKLKKSTLVVQFSGRRKVRIQLPQDSPSLLHEIKEYIEKASLNHRTDKDGLTVERQ